MHSREKYLLSMFLLIGSIAVMSFPFRLQMSNLSKNEIQSFIN